MVEISSDRVTFRIPSNINDGAPVRTRPTGLTRCLFTQKMSTTDLRSDSNADSTRDAVNLRVGGLQVHGIGSRRLVYKEVVELLPNCKKFYF